MAEPEKEKRGIWSRRDFFTRLGWGGFGIFGGLSSVRISPISIPAGIIPTASYF